MKAKTLIFILATLLIASGEIFLAQKSSAAEETSVAGNKEEIDELNRQIAERKDKIQQLEETINQYKKTIEQKRTEAVSLKNQLSILDNKLAQTQTDIELTEEKIAEAQLEIEALELTIAEKEKAIARQKKIISAVVRNINAEDQKNYMEILLTNDNFADFYGQLRNLESIYADLGRSVKTLRLSKEELNAKKEQVAGRKKVYEDLKAELDGKKQDLGEQSMTKQDLLINTKASEARYQTLLESLRKQYQAIEGEMRAYEEQVRKKLSETDKLDNLGTTGDFSWPVSGRYITSAFHDPDYPYRRVFEHSGLDIRAAQGTPVRAAAAGYVARAKRCSTASCYSYIIIVHSGNLSTVYGHLSSIGVSDDQFVARGDIIGYSGGTPGTVGAGPFVTGPHLHFEVRSNGIPVDPSGYLE